MHTTLFRIEHPKTRLGFYNHSFDDCPQSENARLRIARKYGEGQGPHDLGDYELLVNMPHELITRLHGLKFAYSSRLQCLAWFGYNQLDLQKLGSLGFVLGLYRVPKGRYYASKHQAVFLDEDAHKYQAESLSCFHQHVA